MRKRTCLALVATATLLTFCATRTHDRLQWAETAAYPPSMDSVAPMPEPQDIGLRDGESGFICPNHTVAWGGKDSVPKALEHAAEYQGCDLQLALK